MTWRDELKKIGYIPSILGKRTRFIKYIRDTYKEQDKEISDYTEESLVKLEGMTEPKEIYNQMWKTGGRLNATQHFNSKDFEAFWKKLDIKEPEK